jgi:hypothetical protein
MVTRMSRLLILSVIVVSTASGQVQLGLQTGGSFVNLAANSNYPTVDQCKALPGFSIGVVCNAPFFPDSATTSCLL